MKRALILISAVAVLTVAAPREAAAEMRATVHGASTRGVSVPADYDPEAAPVAALPDFSTVVDYLDSDGGFVAALRYVVFLLFSP